MKQKTTFITIALVVAILALGIAYAAITTQNLNVSGSVSADTSNANFDVSFVTAEITPVVEGTNKADVTATAAAAGKNATLNISGLNTKGQKVTAVYTIKNNSADLTAALVQSVDATHDNTDWFDVDVSLGKAELAKGEETTLTVVVTLKKSPATDADIGAAKDEIHITFNADAKQ